MQLAVCRGRSGHEFGETSLRESAAEVVEHDAGPGLRGAEYEALDSEFSRRKARRADEAEEVGGFL